MTYSPLGKLEYSVFPMPRPEKTYVELFEGGHVSEYLEAFAQHKIFAGKTVKDRVPLNHKVTEVSRVEGSKIWALRCGSGKVFLCHKLMIASGLTSVPRIPIFKIRDQGPSFPIIHPIDLAAKSEFLLSPKVKRAVVVGGAKSTFDTVQMLCRAGKQVT
jgi:cation diffusion facilitator CzcD-associated flavoprotein CzcO